LATLRREIAGSLSILSPNVLPGGLSESVGVMAGVAVDLVASPNFRPPRAKTRNQGVILISYFTSTSPITKKPARS
jgi:hypothetical protein